MNEMPSYDWLPVMFAYVEITHFRCEKSSVFPRNYSIRYLRRAPFIYLIYDNSLCGAVEVFFYFIHNVEKFAKYRADLLENSIKNFTC